MSNVFCVFLTGCCMKTLPSWPSLLVVFLRALTHPVSTHRGTCAKQYFHFALILHYPSTIPSAYPSPVNPVHLLTLTIPYTDSGLYTSAPLISEYPLGDNLLLGLPNPCPNPIHSLLGKAM